MTQRKLTDAELACTAADWNERRIDPRDWDDTPEAVPRAGESVSISLRMPKRLLAVLKAFARREGIGYQVLLKKWLDQRVAQELQAIKRERAAIRVPNVVVLEQAASFVIGPTHQLRQDDVVEDLGRVAERVVGSLGDQKTG